MLLSLILSNAFAENPITDDLGDISAPLFRPALDSIRFLATNPSTAGEDRQFSAKALMVHSVGGMSYLDFSGTEQSIIQHYTQLNMMGGYTLGNLRIGLDVPIVLQIEGQMPSCRSLQATSLGDIIIDAKYQLLGKDDALGASFALRSSIPTVGGSTVLGSSVPVIEAEVALDKDLDAFFVAFNAGHRQKDKTTFENSTTGSEYFIRGGIAVPITDNCSIGAEYGSAISYSTDGSSLSEALLNTQGDFAGFTLRTGFGIGFGDAIGTPAWRAFAGIIYTPSSKPKDADADGIFDDVDQCIDVPEDMDSVQDEDGCPDPTAVIINFVDSEGKKMGGVSWTGGDLNGTSGTSLQSQATEFTLTASVDGYKPVSQQVNIPDAADFSLDIPLEMLVGSVQVSIIDEEGKAIEGAQWQVIKGPKKNVSGSEVSLAPGSYILLAYARGFKKMKQDVTIEVDKKQEISLTLKSTKAKVSEGKIDFDGAIHFKAGSSVILDKSYPLLKDIGDIMKDHPEVIKVRVEGHTDSKGNNKKNKELSQARAEAVVTYLVSHGIDAKRMVAEGFGEENPVASNKTKDGREENRRVEIHVLEMKKK
jgi:outer membrane protein OmpA-like peptidoglycan-associated protein